MRIRSSLVLLGLLVAPLTACSFSIGTNSDEEAVETDSGSDRDGSDADADDDGGSSNKRRKDDGGLSGGNDSGDEKGGGSGGDQSDAELEASVAAALQTNLSAAGGGGSSEITDAQSACMAQGLIEELGVARVIELDLASSDELNLSVAEAKAVIPILKSCFDFNGLIAEGILAEAGNSLSSSSARCVADGFAALPLVDELLTIELTGGDSSTFDFNSLDQGTQAELFEVFTTCLTPEELAALANS
jgi:hypothetical protein